MSFGVTECMPTGFEKNVDNTRGHRSSTQAAMRTHDYNKLVSQILHGVFGQQNRFIGGAVRVPSAAQPYQTIFFEVVITN